MNIATLLSSSACALEVLIGGLALAFAQAPGWRHFRVVAMIAFAAAVYSAGNLVFAYPSASPALVVWTARVNAAVACIHCAAWLLFVRRQYGDPQTRSDRWVIRVLFGVALASLVPDLTVSDRVMVEHIAWASVTYQSAQLSVLGSILFLACPLSLVVPLITYVKKARAGVPGATIHIVGFSIFLLAVMNELLVAVHAFQNLYLADIGFLAAAVSVCAEMAHHVTKDARHLQGLSLDLSRQVEERTRELMLTRDNLIHTERLAALGRLSASVGHEINNPLSYVIGNLDYVRRELELDTVNSAVLSALDDAQGGADKIRRIVRELRAFSKTSDKDELEVVDLAAALEDALKLVQGELRHRARLERRLDGPAKVLANPTKLTQVFVNILLNAAQAIPDERAGGPDSLVTVRTQPVANGNVCVSVTDTGAGISPEAQRRLFEPFFSTKSQDKGTGLGLFVSLGIVSAIGGRIDVESRPGHGTTVKVVLPAWQGTQGPERRRGARVSERVPLHRRMLIVDDDVLVARTLARQLRGNEVEIVGSGRQALARLREAGAEFDLVLCDLMMPDMTGMELYAEIRAHDPQLAARFLFISGGGITERSRRFLEEHAERVLAKPIDSAELAIVLNRFMRDQPDRDSAASA
jgi:signal transduction histidine kinase/ActR/RegA family two-component response regulator